MDSRNQNSQPQYTDGVQSAAAELPVTPKQWDDNAEELAIKRQIWKNVCERLNELERKQISFREAQRGKNGT